MTESYICPVVEKKLVLLKNISLVIEALHGPLPCRVKVLRKSPPRWNNLVYIIMSSLQDTRAKLASHFSNGTADDGSKWSALWDKGDFLPWDRQMPNPALEDILADRQDLLGSPIIKQGTERLIRKKALVPGCGKGYDVLLLASFGYDAYGLEVSESAVKQCLKEQADNGSKYPVKDEVVGAGKATFIHGNFFKIDWLHEVVGEDGKFDLHYDYTVSFSCKSRSPPSQTDSR